MTTVADFPTTYLPRRLVPKPLSGIGAVVGIAALIYLPMALTTHSLFGIALTTGSTLGIGLANINQTLAIVIGAIGLNLLTGYAGLVSLGNAAFFGLGGFTAALICAQLGWPFPVAIIASAATGAIVGLLVGLPALRVRGLYLILETLGLQYLLNYVFIEYESARNAASGINISTPVLFGFALSSDMRWYYLLLGFVAVSLLLVRNLLASREGRALIAVRDQEVAAASMGINTRAVKIKVFVISSAMVSVGGCLYATYLGNASDATYSIGLALAFVAMIILGGLGTLGGAVVGAFVWQLLPIALAQVVGGGGSSIGEGYVAQNAPQISQVILGVIILVVLRFAPHGLVGLWKDACRIVSEWPL
jgi:branched-chain amino acid transport system permease protein